MSESSKSDVREAIDLITVGSAKLALAMSIINHLGDKEISNRLAKVKDEARQIRNDIEDKLNEH